jgi:hypothetical protein
LLNFILCSSGQFNLDFGWGVGHDHVLIVFIYLACGTPPSLHLHEIDLLVKQEKAPLTLFMSKELYQNKKRP